MRNCYLPEPLVTGSETLLDPESSALFATDILTVYPICQEKSEP